MNGSGMPAIDLRDYTLNHAAAKAMWWSCYRPSIQMLFDTDKNLHDAALLLMVPCMEKVFTLENPQFKKRTVPYGEVLLRFFPYLGKEECELFRQRVANGLKHDSFIRSEIFDLKYPGSERYEHIPISLLKCWISDTVVQDFDELPEDEKMTFLVINKASFWEAVYPQIDDFYGETSQKE